MAMATFASCTQKENQDEPEEKKEEEEIIEEWPEYEVSAEVNPFTWIAIDDNGNTIDPDNSGYRKIPEKEKTDGIFYFLWHGCHGYDVGANSNQVVPPNGDTKSPYDIQKLLDENPDNPQYGPQYAMHHWGEPYLGYYVMNDEWVIRKHAQMLSDAGVDVIFFDVTNGFHYIPIVKQMCEIYTRMRADGCKTPQFAFLMNSTPESVLWQCNKEIYSQGLYKDLWFYWDGKPLALCDPNQIGADFKANFTYRQSWYLWNNDANDTWWGSGKQRGVDKWPWGGLYPQQVGRHGGKNEFCYVLPATHPISNIGRSYDAINNVEPKQPKSGEGIFFKSQFQKAFDYDPSFLFFTGWNEWTAQKQVSANGGECDFLGHHVTRGETYFVDQYNHEFSRDIEPLNGDFGDNYYYLMVDMIRKFKGTKHLPTFKETNSITIDGEFSDWNDVKALYGDNKGDIFHRSHYGWGRIGTYTNDTGRNDIVLSKVTNDGTNLYFYAATNSDLTPATDPQWMQLFIKVKGEPGWEGFDYVVNRTISEGQSSLEKCKGGWDWQELDKVSLQTAKNELEIAIPLSALGITDPSKFAIDFKWVDNAVSDGDIQTCMRDGDSAPDGRFRYRYKFEK